MLDTVDQTVLDASQGHEDDAARETKVVRVSCPHDCPDTCSLLVTVDTKIDRAIRVEGNPEHPFTNGYLCNKVNHYLDLVYSENRVLYPHRRVGPKGPGAKFVRISWEEALKAVTDNFKSVIAEHGPDAVQPYSYSGTLGLLGYIGMSQRFFSKMAAANLGRTICIAAASAAGCYTFGAANGTDPMEMANAEYIILWGTNLVSTGVHLVPFIQQAKERGAKVVVIDPRMTRTVEMLADWHIKPLPGTDGALALGMMNVIVGAGLHDEEFLKEQTIGWEKLLSDELPKYTPEAVAKITGLKAEDIRKLALEYAATKKSYIRANYGLNRHENGGMMVRTILLLPVITGALREKSGGAIMGTIEEMWSVDFGYLCRGDLLDGRTPRTVNMVQIGEALNSKTLSPPIKSMFVWNSDPANCTPDTADTRRGMMREDLFVAVHDTFWTDSCDYADIVLPADTQFEHEDLHAAYGNYFFGHSTPAIAPLGESKCNQQLFRELAEHMGYTEDCFKETDEEIIRRLIDPKVNSLFEGITYESLKEKGFARGHVEADRRNYLKNGWPTPSKKIEIYSETMEKAGLPPLPTYIPEREGLGMAKPDKRYPIQLLSPASHYFIGDSFTSVPRLVGMQSRPTIELNEEDAKERGIEEGDLCRIYNDRGETFCYAIIVDGFLHNVAGTQKQYRGSLTPSGQNVNATNSQELTDMGGGPCFYSNMVQIEKASSNEILSTASPRLRGDRSIQSRTLNRRV
jgi:anaerobic selenocysteine-containing dehydrogenase